MTGAGIMRRGGRLAVATAVAGTVFIASGAFWLSFVALSDLAKRSGIGVGQAWVWPLIVDGIIVVATVSVVALAGQPGAWYPWLLLFCGAVVSVTGNALHAVVTADTDMPGMLAGAVAAVPPVVLVAITHLTVTLTRPVLGTFSPHGTEDVKLSTVVDELGTAEQALDAPLRQELAVLLRDEGLSNKAIARVTGVHATTVGRWLGSPAAPTRAPTRTENGDDV